MGLFKYIEKYDTEKIGISDCLIEYEFNRFSRILRSGIMEKKAPTAFLLWLIGLLGVCGLHRFYVGRTWTGLLWLFTFGLLGLGQLFDLFLLGSMVRQANILNGLKAGASANTNTNSNAVAPVFNIQVGLPTAAPTVVQEPTKSV